MGIWLFIMSKIPEVCFKNDLIFQRFDECHPVLKSLAEEMCKWCSENKVLFMITESKTTDAEDRILHRVSKTHAEGRAFDMSSKNWKPEMIEKFIAYFSHKYAGIAAIGISGPRLIWYHDSGNGEHFHVQIKPGLSTENIAKV